MVDGVTAELRMMKLVKMLRRLGISHLTESQGQRKAKYQMPGWSARTGLIVACFLCYLNTFIKSGLYIFPALLYMKSS